MHRVHRIPGALPPCGSVHDQQEVPRSAGIVFRLRIEIGTVQRHVPRMDRNCSCPPCAQVPVEVLVTAYIGVPDQFDASSMRHQTVCTGPARLRGLPHRMMRSPKRSGRSTVRSAVLRGSASPAKPTIGRWFDHDVGFGCYVTRSKDVQHPSFKKAHATRAVVACLRLRWNTKRQEVPGASWRRWAQMLNLISMQG